jgi:Icc-related predicted phosphoesterase
VSSEPTTEVATSEPHAPSAIGPREEGRKPIRVAAVGDLHARLDRPDHVRRLLRPVNSEADILLLAGDLTDHGDPQEAEMLMDELSVVRIPMVAVLGNHDYEQGKASEVLRVVSQGGARVLDGDIFVFEKRLAIAGVKGFCGGFGEATLEPWGEDVIKRFVFEAVNESLKLEGALARIRSFPRRIALMHYSPLRATVEGENPEIAAFLGCSRLAEPIDKFSATLAIHGHAHHGQLTGRSDRGTPVYNAAMELLHKQTGKRYLVLEV